MRLAEYLDHDIQNVYKQKGPTCSAHTFFTTVQERIKSKYGVDLEFAMNRYFDDMMLWRQTWNDAHPTWKKKRRLRAFMDMGAYFGWQSESSETIKIKGYMLMQTFDTDRACKWIQKHGPMMISIQQYNELTLNPKGEYIKPLPRRITPKLKGHALILRGFDRKKGYFKIHNSWGDNSVKWLDFESLKRIWRWGYVIKDIKLIR